jgi:23S rRNA (pseudouridine1915-N3)-methyltransferase
LNIKVYIIDKKGKKEIYDPLVQHYIKIAKPFAKIEVIELFSNTIAKAQEINAKMAKESYTKAFIPFLAGKYNIALTPEGNEVDSFEFAKLLQKQANIAFYVGGAYGFEEKFLKSCQKEVSFGKITLSHKLVKVVLLEQIYRGLTIINNHPYHK